MIDLAPTGRFLYWSEVPSPGVESRSRPNTIHRLNLRTNDEAIIHTGAREPTDIAVDRDDNVYWTCTSAGVIVQATLIRRR